MSVSPVPFRRTGLFSALRLSRLGSIDPMLAALCCAAAAVRLFFWWYTRRVWEDALITVLHSENFYAGLGLTHFKIDDPRPVHGFTSPLSVLIPLVGDFFSVGFGLTLLRIVSVAAGVAAVVYGYRLTLEYLAPGSKYAALLAGGYLAVEHHQILWGMAGMETQIATAILLASMYYLLKLDPVKLGLTLGLCLLARPDFALWVGIALIVVAFRCFQQRSWRNLVRVLAPAGALYLPWVTFTILYYGSPVPNTIVAKSLGYPIWWKITQLSISKYPIIVWRIARNEVFRLLGPSFGGNGTGFIPFPYNEAFVMVSLLSIVAGLALLVLRKRFLLLPLYAFAIAHTLFLVFGAPFIFGWYCVPLAAVLVLLLAASLWELLQWLPRRFELVLGFGFAAVFLSGFVSVLPLTFRGERNIQSLVEGNVRIAIGKYLGQVMTEKETAGGEPLGYIGYYSRRTYYDYPGLASRKVVTWLKTQQSRPRPLLLQMLGYTHPDYIVLRHIEYTTFSRQPDGQFLRDYTVERSFTVSTTQLSQLLFPQANVDLYYFVLHRRAMPSVTHNKPGDGN